MIQSGHAYAVTTAKRPEDQLLAPGLEQDRSSGKKMSVWVEDMAARDDDYMIRATHDGGQQLGKQQPKCAADPALKELPCQLHTIHSP